MHQKGSDRMEEGFYALEGVQTHQRVGNEQIEGSY